MPSKKNDGMSSICDAAHPMPTARQVSIAARRPFVAQSVAVDLAAFEAKKKRGVQITAAPSPSDEILPDLLHKCAEAVLGLAVRPFRWWLRPARSRTRFHIP